MRQICRQLIHILAFYAVGIAGMVLADTPQELPPRLQAIEHLREHGGIAVLVSVGTKDIYTGDQIGQAVVKKFKSMHNVEIVHFSRQSTGNFGYLEFYIDGFGLGQHGADAWDTPEEVKELFDDVYYYYIAGLKRKLH